MRHPIFLLAVTLALLPASLRAAEPADMPPKPPFVQPPPERSAWTIEVTRPEAEEAAQNANNAQKQQVVVEIASAHDGESKRDVVSYSDGSKREFWFVGDYVLTPYPDGSRVGVSSGDSEVELAEPTESPRFPGLNWISADSYAGVAEKGGQQCRHYVRAGGWEAWIGLESGLPVAAKFGSVVHTYAFTTPPAAPLQMPDIYAKALESVNQQAARADALAENMPPRPPFVLPPPKQSAWTIKVARPAVLEAAQNAKNAQKQREVVEIASAHDGESKRDVVSYSDGSKREFWFVGDYALWPYPDGSRAGVSSGDSEVQLPEPVESPRFPGLAWLSADSYEGVAKMGGQQCRHYVRPGEGDVWEAYIGFESGLPVAARFGSVVHNYAFTTPPAGPLQMPEMFAQALEDVKEQAARAEALGKKFQR